MKWLGKFKFPFRRKKPWDKVACNFIVQENLPGGTSGGWNIITQASGEIPTKAEVSEFFKPGRHYRVMARALSDGNGYKAGTFVGVVWKHYESMPGGVALVVKPKALPKGERKPVDPSKVMGEWAEGLKKQLEPIQTFAEAMNELREGFAAIAGPPAAGEGPPAAGQGPGWGDVPPLTFDGSPPWMLHPYIVHTLAEEAKSLITYGADRLEGIMGKGPAPLPGEEVEEEEVLLPSLIEEAPVEE
ncbi:unnamed protein product, partial [marine sediment metagenome]